MYTRYMFIDHTPSLQPLRLVTKAAKMTIMWSCWQVRKLTYKEVFERFTNNLWSHGAQGFLLLRVSHIIKYSYLEGQLCSFDHINAIPMSDFIFG